MMSKFVLVTGGAGYIGSHTVVSLVQNGFKPVIVDDFRNASKVVLQGLEGILGEQPILHELDVCNKESLDQLFQQYSFDGVIHFAAYKAVGESVAEPLKYYRNNILGLINVLSCVIDHQVNNFVFSSSCTVYGEPVGQKEVTETTPKLLPESPYGYTKWMGEQIIADTFRSAPQLRIMNLRYFNPVGAHHSAQIGEFPIGRPNNLLPFITQTAIGKQEQLTVFGNDYPTKDGTCVRDFIHVVDLADAHVRALQFLWNQNSGLIEYLNVGTGKGSSVLELIKAFEQKTGLSLNWKFGPRREGDVVEIYANVDNSFKKIGWKAERTIEDAVMDAWNWEKHLNSLL